MNRRAMGAVFPGSFTDLLAGTGIGNLAGLVEHLSAGGLDQQVKSWLGTGENLPVNSDQLRNALGEEHVQKICQQVGLPAEHILHRTVIMPAPNENIMSDREGRSELISVRSAKSFS